MKTQSAAEIFKSHNKAIEEKIIKECRELPIITKHFATVYDDAYNEPIQSISTEQKQELKKLIDEI